MTGNRHTKFGSFGRRLAGLLCLSAVTLAGLSSCDDVIYDYEGDCSFTYLVKFNYDYNMLFANAFAHEINCVTLYVIDAEGNIVWQKTEQGAALGEEDYAMTVDVDPGQYSLLAWCGDTDNGSWIVPSTVYETGLTCTLDLKYNADGSRYIDDEIDRLYYGYLPDQIFTDEEGIHIYTVPLMKDTNTVRVVLQEINAGQIDVNDFEFTITSDDWILDWDNSPIAEENTTYYAFYTGSAEAEIETKASYMAAVAEFTISRIMADRSTRLTIYNVATGEVTLSFDLGQLAGLLKSYYVQDMGDQEYLDREDTYDMVFFLDGDNGNRWVNTFIYVNSWLLVLQTTGLG